MSTVKISYGAFALGAKDHLTVDALEKLDFIDLNELKRNDLRVGNYANPCEQYQTLLDGSMLVLPEDKESIDLGYWSEKITDEDGVFWEGQYQSAVGIYLTLDEFFSSSGITITFDTDNNIYPTKVEVIYYQSTDEYEESLSKKTFTPDSPVFFFAQPVELYNLVELNFYGLNMPHNRLRIRSIDFGFNRVFTAEELKKCSVIQQMDTISETLPISTCDFTLNIKDESLPIFQEKQPIRTYFNDKLIAKTFVEKYTRKTKTDWQVSTEDYFGMLDDVTFMGDIYDNKNVEALIDEILTPHNIPFTISENLKSMTVTGHIPICSGREALQRVCFACGAVASTANSENVDIYELSEEIKTSVPLSRIKQGASFERLDRITEMQLTAHSFIPTDEVKTLYEAKKKGSGENIFIKFSEPYYNLSITEDSEIVASGANYAIINARENCVLTGKKYEHKETIKTMKNPIVLSGEMPKVKAITNQYLISADNVDKILELCYNYYIKDLKSKISVFERKQDTPAFVGDNIEFATEYLGTKQGRIEEQRFNLNGRIILKKCEIV